MMIVNERKGFDVEFLYPDGAGIWYFLATTIELPFFQALKVAREHDGPWRIRRRSDGVVIAEKKRD